MERKLQRKPVANFTTTDLYNHWGVKFQAYYGRSFQGYKPRDLKMLKELNQDFSSAEIVLAMNEAMNMGVSDIPYFVGQIERFIGYREPLASWYLQLERKTPEQREVAYDLIARYMLMSGESVYRRDDEIGEIKKQIEEILA